MLPTALRCHWAPCSEEMGRLGVHRAAFPPQPITSLTLDVLGVVDDKVSVPNHR